ncbi:MAG: riboflavin synthase [Deltaproteobacteria bacterium]|nr:riboflavin synthase [Deltaproteobacteria bacterium]MBW2396481.1 riboflavin synthase [Deltaproteobacteria bacterium]
MFTGIVEAVGRINALTPCGEHVRIEIAEPGLAAEVGMGDSVAVSGACLTVAAFGEGQIGFDAIRETLVRTSLGDLQVGDPVNLERAMRADGRFDGHIVQGHVDEAGRVRALERDGSDVRLRIDTSAEFAGLLVGKGSVTIDGVSLTVVDVEAEGFDVALIPHTLEVTTLGRLSGGERVNLEADVLGKYVKQYLERIGPGLGAGA